MFRATTLEAFHDALTAARTEAGPSVVVVPVDRDSRVGGCESWWDVPVAEVSTEPAVQRARALYEEARRKERDFL